MNVYPVPVTLNGKRETICLRLDVGAIRKLKADTGKDALDIITDAANDPGTMADLLNASMRFVGNNNPITLNGDELFNALVEDGKCGAADWMEIANGVASVSGILQSQYGTAMVEKTHRRMDKAFKKLLTDDDDAPAADEEAAADPTKKQAAALSS